MSYYYWFNRKEILEKVHDKYHLKGGKEKAVCIIKNQRNNKKEKKAGIDQ